MPLRENGCFNPRVLTFVPTKYKKLQNIDEPFCIGHAEATSMNIAIEIQTKLAMFNTKLKNKVERVGGELIMRLALGNAY